MKVLFITPPYHAGVLECAGSWIPLHYVHLAGAVEKAGGEGVIYDAMTKFHDLDRIARRIRAERPDVVAVGAVTAQIPAALSVIGMAKRVNPSIVTILGGGHATFMNEEVLDAEPSLDLVVRGEGERTMVDILSALGDGSPLDAVPGVTTRNGSGPERPLIEDLDDLPAAWHLLDWEDYTYSVFPGSRLASVSSSRGCNHECSFCSQQRFWNRAWRPRSPEAFLGDLDLLARRYHVDTVLIPDEYPTSDRRRWEAILEGLLSKDLGIRLLLETRAEDIVRDADLLSDYRKAGIIHVYVGIEAAEQEGIDSFSKDLTVDISRAALRRMNRAGIVTETSFILGMPDETPEHIERTLGAAFAYAPDFAHFLTIAPWPYADLYPEVEPFIEVRDYADYNLVTPVVKPEAMSREEVMSAILSSYRIFYTDKITHLDGIADRFKRDYLLRSMMVMMRSSFLKKHMGGLGGMPGRIERMLVGMGLLEGRRATAADR